MTTTIMQVFFFLNPLTWSWSHSLTPISFQCFWKSRFWREIMFQCSNHFAFAPQNKGDELSSTYPLSFGGISSGAWGNYSWPKLPLSLFITININVLTEAWVTCLMSFDAKCLSKENTLVCPARSNDSPHSKIICKRFLPSFFLRLFVDVLHNAANVKSMYVEAV